MTDELPPQLQALADRLAATWGESIDVGPGWFDLLIRLDTQLTSLSPGYVVQQCKSKFGGLRFYAQPEETDADIQLAFRDLIWAAEDESTHTCEDCGEPAEQIDVNGWTLTLCPKHAQEQTESASGTLTTLRPSDGITNIGSDGLPPGRDCPACEQPLEPGHIDDTIALVWLCPTHGVVERTENPFSEPQ